MMRISGGIYKGRQISPPEGRDTRPTLAMVKEAVFGKLQFDIPNKSFLDLFAGSGAMGIEALSRGASTVVFNDNSTKAVRLVKKNLDIIGASSEVLCFSYKAAINACSGRGFDFIYADPPYALDCIDDILSIAADTDALAVGGMLVYEHGRERDLSISDIRYIIVNEKRYSSTVISYIRRES